jgi:4-amino-4-deoxy-L-arabinose transferase-like glycosyltransferase
MTQAATSVSHFRALLDKHIFRWATVDTGAVLTLLAAVLILALTASWNGEFWWFDGARHAMNGAFIADLLRDMPLGELQSWAVNYYLQYPALTILFYPPLFPACEAIAFLLFGVSQATALATVVFFYALLALGSYALARRMLPPLSATAAALMVCVMPEVAFWGRQVMTEIPAYAFLVWSAFFFDRALAGRRPVDLYAAIGLLLLALCIRLTVVFMMPVYAVLLLVHWRAAALRNRHVLGAAGVAAVGIIPLAWMTWKFGQVNIASAGHSPGAPGRDSLATWLHYVDTVPGRDSLASWLYYLEALPSQVGWLPLILAAGYILALATGRDRVLPSRALHMLALWFALGYLFFSSILLKEQRWTIFLLLPIALVAAAAPGQWLKSARISGGVALGVALVVFTTTLAFKPAPYVRGHEAAARWIIENTPPGRVMYSGFRDGHFIFNVRVLDTARRYTIVRTTKLFALYAVRPSLGVKQTDLDAEGMKRRLQELGIAYVVAERDFLIDLKAMRTFQDMLESHYFEELVRIPVSTNYPSAGGDTDVHIYRMRDPVSKNPAPLVIDLPAINQRFEQKR